VVIAFNFIGDALRDALEVRSSALTPLSQAGSVGGEGWDAVAG
jgi:hypothetical protein